VSRGRNDTSGHRWWRANLAGLIALALLLPATVVIVGGNEWWDKYLGEPVFAAATAVDGTVAYGGAEFGPAAADFLTDSETAGMDVPPGARVVVARIPVSAPESISCSSPTLREVSSGREWSGSRVDLGIAYDADVIDFCSSETVGDYEIEVPFIVAGDARGPFALELFSGELLPSFVRLVVDP
jgi:hypothetical protein